MIAYPTSDERLALGPAARPMLPSSLPSRCTAARRSLRHNKATFLKSLWLCAYFPNLSLEAAGYATGDVRPYAIFEENGTQRLVYRASAAASAAGVTRGIKLSQAYALCPALKVQVRDAAAEMARLSQLAAWAGRFTPVV